MSQEEHRSDAGGISVRCIIVTCSDTRTPENDTSGDLIATSLEHEGHTVVARHLVRENPGAVAEVVRSGFGLADVLILTGGTGLSSRDGTIEAVTPLLDRVLPGFGELFRMLSFEEIGAAAMLTRAVAGSRGRTAVFVLPGSVAAVGLAMEKLILPELRHVVRELRR